MTTTAATTQHITSPATTGKPAAGTTKIAGNFAVGDFWTMLFANMGAQGGAASGLQNLLQTKISASTDTAVATDSTGNPASGKKTKMDDLSGLLAIMPFPAQQITLTEKTAGADIMAEGDILPEEFTGMLTTTFDATTGDAATFSVDMQDKTNAAADKGEQKKFLDILSSLLNGMPLENRKEGFEITLKQPAEAATAKNNAQTIITTPVNDAESAQVSAALIATGLSPEQITKLMKQISDSTTGEGEIPVITKIILPQEKKEIVFIPRSVLLAHAAAAKTPEVSTDAPSSMDNIAAKLNNLMTGETAGTEEFTLPETETIIGKGTKTSDAMAQIMNVMKAAQTQTKTPTNPALSTFFGDASALPDGLYFTSSLSGQIYPDGIDWSRDGANGMSPLTLGGPGMAASLVNTAQNAGASHPAVQIIAATLAKAGGEGTSKNITIRLEPPELGRVEVKLEFAKDKTMKAHMLIEKPETYAMLQRDSHVLERALQDSGLNSGNMSFELAQDGGQFDHGSGRNGGHGSSDTPSHSDENIEVIESTMTWQINPDSGHVHYDLLV